MPSGTCLVHHLYPFKNEWTLWKQMAEQAGGAQTEDAYLDFISKEVLAYLVQRVKHQKYWSQCVLFLAKQQC